MCLGKGAERMQGHKTNIPHSCRQTLLKFSQEKGKEKKAEINRQRETERKCREKRQSKEKCQFKRNVSSELLLVMVLV